MLKRGVAWEATQGLNSSLLLSFIFLFNSIFFLFTIIIIIIMSHSQCFVGVIQKTVTSKACPRFTKNLMGAVTKNGQPTYAS